MVGGRSKERFPLVCARSAGGLRGTRSNGAGAFGHRAVEYVGSMENGIDAIVQAAGEGDVVITLGAGSVSQAADRILKALRESH